MAEALEIATKVTNPPALAAFLAILFCFSYRYYLKSWENRLAALPEDQRAKAMDEYLSRYGIDGLKLTKEQSYKLIGEEMAKRHRRYCVYAIVLAVAIVVIVAIATIGYCLVNKSPAPEPPPPSMPQPTPPAPQPTALNLRVLENPTHDLKPKHPRTTPEGVTTVFQLSNGVSGLAVVDELGVDVIEVIEDKAPIAQTIVSKYDFEVKLDPNRRGSIKFAGNFKYAQGEVDTFFVNLSSIKQGHDYFYRIIVKWFDSVTQESKSITSDVLVARFPEFTPEHAKLPFSERGRLADEQERKIEQTLQAIKAKINQK
jgi:hypothetical protein